MDTGEMVGFGSGIAAAAGLLGRWLGLRSAERRDALQQMIERVGRLEGRCDELSAANLELGRQLNVERVRHTEQLNELHTEIAGLNDRIALLEQERDAARAEAAELRRRGVRRPSSAPEMQAVTTTAEET